MTQHSGNSENLESCGWSTPSNAHVSNLKTIGINLLYWNKNVFRQPNKKIDKLVKEIDRIINKRISEASENLLKQKLNQLESLHDTQEAISKRDSRDNIIYLGEQNTKYFHVITLSKRTWNNIECISSNRNTIIHNKAEIGMILTDYF